MLIGEKLGYSNLYVKYAGVLLDKNVCVNLFFPSVCSKVLQRSSFFQNLSLSKLRASLSKFSELHST